MNPKEGSLDLKKENLELLMQNQKLQSQIQDLQLTNKQRTPTLNTPNSPDIMSYKVTIKQQ